MLTIKNKPVDENTEALIRLSEEELESLFQDLKESDPTFSGQHEIEFKMVIREARAVYNFDKYLELKKSFVQ